jgi:hypothetical protein
MKFVRSIFTKRDGTKVLNLPKAATDCECFQDATKVELDFNEREGTITITKKRD